MDLLRDPAGRLFSRYLAPSVSASLVTSIYILADTVMIGRGVGAEALAALSLVLPLFAMLFAVGMLFGAGGGVLYSVARGAGDDKRADAVWSTSLVCVSVLAVVLTVLCTALLTPICRLLGADGSNMAMVREYAVFVATGAPFFIFSTFLQAFVRNDRDPKRSMAAVLIGSAVNIVFDYIFIFPLGMGMTGGAAATVMGNAVTVIVLLTHLRVPTNQLHFRRRMAGGAMAGSIVAAGAPSFLIEAATALTMFSFNRQLLRYLGHMGVVVYGVIANYAIVLQSLFNGVGQAAQPIIAANFGASQFARVHAVRRMGLGVVLLIGTAAVAVFWAAPDMLVRLFVVPDDGLLAMARPALRLYAPAFVPYGVNLFLAVYLQSVVRAMPALLIMVLRGVALPLAFVLLLPALWGGEAIFAAVLLAEGVTSAAAAVLLLGTKKEQKQSL